MSQIPTECQRRREGVAVSWCKFCRVNLSSTELRIVAMVEIVAQIETKVGIGGVVILTIKSLLEAVAYQHCRHVVVAKAADIVELERQCHCTSLFCAPQHLLSGFLIGAILGDFVNHLVIVEIAIFVLISP